MKNRLSDLNTHLFSQMERLCEEGLSPERIEEEARRGEAIVAVADQIIRNAALQLRGAEMLATHGQRVAGMLPMLDVPKPQEQPKVIPPKLRGEP